MWWKQALMSALCLAVLAGAAWAQDATINYPKDQEVKEGPPEGTILEEREYEPQEGVAPGHKFQLEFGKLDADGDGEVSSEEFKQATEEQERYLDAVFQAMDVDGDGELSEQEFAEYKEKSAEPKMEREAAGQEQEMTTPKAGQPGEEPEPGEQQMEGEKEGTDLDMTFTAMDKDMDGQVSQAEFESLVDTSGQPQLFEQVDQDGDGVLTREEFLQSDQEPALWPLAKERAGEEFGEQETRLQEMAEMEGAFPVDVTFEQLDQNKSGDVTLMEFKETKPMLEQVPEFDEIDTNKDDRITAQEFEQWQSEQQIPQTMSPGTDPQ